MQKFPDKRRRRRRRSPRNLMLMFLAVACLTLIALDYHHRNSENPVILSEIRPENISAATAGEAPEELPEALRDLLKHNEETCDFVKGYANREQYLSQTIDLSADRTVTDAIDAGEVPLLMQWDLRWGYAPYGDDIIGLAGCGPTCLSMAYIHLTGDTTMHPAAMADFAFKQGFYSEYGTDWALWTDGAEHLGLHGKELALDESAMKDALKDSVIVCSMRPGDFTTTGHFILIRGYDENGFYVNDPNRRSNSDRQWTYRELWPQIKNLWRIW